MILRLFFLFSYLGSSFLWGQTASRVLDATDNLPLEFVTVSLLSKSGKLLTGTTTDTAGRFTLPTHAGGHELVLSHLGYREHHHLLGEPLPAAFRLEVDRALLATVDVTAERTSVRNLLDRKVIEVGKDLQAAGGAAADLLDQLPEIQSDPQGNLSLLGSGNVRVLLDGKPSSIPANELLRQLPAAAILRVEIITTPGARFRAEGLSGLINIITNGRVEQGLGGDVGLSANTFGSFSSNAGLRLGRKHFALHGSLTQWRGRILTETAFGRTGLAPFSRAGERTFLGNSYRGRIGGDWFPDPRNEFSLELNLDENGHTMDYHQTLMRAGNPTVPLRSFPAHLHRTASLNLNYRHQFQPDTEHYLEVDARRSRTANDLDRETFIGDRPAQVQVVTSLVDLLDLAADYNNPLSSRVTLSLGGLYTTRALTNQQRDGDGRADFFSFDQHTSGAYAEGSLRMEQWQFRAGLRYEDYRAVATFPTTSLAPVRQRFGSFFPSFHAVYQVAAGRQLSFALNRRTSRPYFSQVNPYPLLTVPTDQSRGNPALRPEFGTNLTVTYRRETENGQWEVGGFFRRKVNNIYRLPTVEGDLSVTTYVNIGTPLAYGGHLNLTWSPISWYRGVYALHGGIDRLDLPTELAYANASGYWANLNLRHTFTLHERVAVDLSWRGYPRTRSFLGTEAGRHRFDVSLRYRPALAGLRLTLRFSDVFNSYRHQTFRFGENFSTSSLWNVSYRMLTCNATYHFQKGTATRKRQRKQRRYDGGTVD